MGNYVRMTVLLAHAIVLFQVYPLLNGPTSAIRQLQTINLRIGGIYVIVDMGLLNKDQDELPDKEKVSIGWNMIGLSGFTVGECRVSVNFVHRPGIEKPRIVINL